MLCHALILDGLSCQLNATSVSLLCSKLCSTSMALGFAIEHIRWIDCRYVPGGGFHVVAAHTDSPCPKLKPVAHGSKEGDMSVQVHMYGTGMWQTWFDRDLSIAGRVLMRRKGRELTHELVRVRRPMLHTPTLPIRGDSWKSDLEAQLAPLLAIQIEAELTISCESESSLPVEKHEHGIHVYPSNGSSHHPLLLQVSLEI